MKTSRFCGPQRIAVPLTAAAIAAATIAVGLGGAADANAATGKTKPVVPAHTHTPTVEYIWHAGVVYRWVEGTPLPWLTPMQCPRNAGCANVFNDY